MKDEGSKLWCAKAEVQGVPMYGILDSGANITIVGGEVFNKVARIAEEKKV